MRSGLLWIGEMSFEGMERQFWNQNFNSDSTKSEYSNFESQVFLSQIAIQLLRVINWHTEPRAGIKEMILPTTHFPYSK
jgi:hypothetical protein